MKKFLGFLLLFLMISFSKSAIAASNQDVIINKDNSIANITVQEKGDYFKVYDENNKLIYNSSSNKLKVNISENIQKYKIGVYNKKKLSKVIAIKIDNSSKIQQEKPKAQSEGFTILNKNSDLENKKLEYNKDISEYPEQKSVDKSIEKNGLQVQSSSDGVSLSWNKIIGSNNVYKIYKNEKLIKVTKDLNYRDTNVKTGKRYTYTVETKVPLGKTSINKVNKKLKKQKIDKKKLSMDEKDNLYNISAVLSSIVDVPEVSEESLKTQNQLVETSNVKSQKGSSNLVKAQSTYSKTDAFSIIYNTFIPYKSVADPNFIQGGYLKGDGRKFNRDASSSRTHSMVNLQFQNPTSIRLAEKKIGRSYRCSDKDCKKVLESNVASNKGIFIDVGAASSKKLSFTFYHTARIPFETGFPGVSYPSIDSRWTLTMTNSSLVISGQHDKAPNHEIYLVSMAGKAQTLYRFSVSGTGSFKYLIDVFPKQSFKKTF
ncbi:hypothetical protein NST56_18600 [Bacillus sp. FSL R5-0560]|uniref:hypothetical protein n=1 Tax=Bacillus sp. FSL R5-0560 TaxID=2954588 RepID=UPI0030CDDCAC